MKRYSLLISIILILSSFILNDGPAYAVQGVAKDSILIGAFGPITGPVAFVGLGARDGMNMAVKEINAAGGIHGRKLKVIFEDDAASPSRALASKEIGRSG